jgi:hypothetical protein
VRASTAVEYAAAGTSARMTSGTSRSAFTVPRVGTRC